MRKPGTITVRWRGAYGPLDVKKVGRMPDGGGWRVHGRDSVHPPCRRSRKEALGQARLCVPASAVALPMLELRVQPAPKLPQARYCKHHGDEGRCSVVMGDRAKRVGDEEQRQAGED